jgi:Antitoxin of toxin-antitoxin, RelE / RelB, TA system
MVTEALLTVLLAKDNGHYCANCPELDLVTELPTADAALEDLIEAIRDYAKEYLQDRDRYAISSNSAHHAPYIEAIAACKTDWGLRTLIEIKHGLVHV